MIPLLESLIFESSNLESSNQQLLNLLHEKDYTTTFHFLYRVD